MSAVHSDEMILDATRSCLLASGIHRTTLSDVARHCGVSRMTLYRRYGDVRSLIQQAMEREFTRILREYEEKSQSVSATARERLVAGVVAVVGGFRDNPLLSLVTETAPEIVASYAMRRFTSTQQDALALLAARVSQGHDDGSIRRDSVAVQAHVLLVTAQSFVVCAPATRDTVPAERLLTELALLIDSYLRPPEPES